MNDFLVIAISIVVAVVITYWFWPGKAKCVKCENVLNDYGYCSNIACSFASRQQPFESDRD